MPRAPATASPTAPPDAYIETVFDGFANSFDAKLAMLDYRAPALVAETVSSLFGEPARKKLAVLDAGCGTGLCGPLLAPYARRLDGVDLSEQMLAKARARNVYDTLAKAELTAFIDGAAPRSYDLIVSADTLCYFGDLQAVARAAAKALRSTGLAGLHRRGRGRCGRSRLPPQPARPLQPSRTLRARRAGRRRPVRR